MKRIVIDTNVIVSFLTDRDLRQQQTAARLFGGAADGEHDLILHQFVVTELIYVLGTLYNLAPGHTAGTIRELIDMPGVSVVDAMPWGDAISLWPMTIESYADAALAAITRSGGYDSLATFDGDFRKRLKRIGVRPYPA